MEQSAGSRNTPLGKNPFWERSSTEPPLRWERLSTQIGLAVLAQGGITMDTLLHPKPHKVALPPEPS